MVFALGELFCYPFASTFKSQLSSLIEVLCVNAYLWFKAILSVYLSCTILAIQSDSQILSFVACYPGKQIEPSCNITPN